ncbi:LicD family protein [Lysinibacillus sp. NPDC097287]|uniref:LicD family protein n=1 Tax=Lysinibacillus sp. NPDC097287 TaxID=3364144 RepID=UPI003804C5FA
MDKLKVYIFGASIGGETYYNLERNNIEVIGFLDNDKKKQGKQIDGISISNPEILKDISKEEYDFVVVTSMYIDSIIEQLLELGISKNQLKFPPKSQLKINKKPFETAELREKATNLLCKINEVLKDEKCFISFGTLLGIVREKQLLSWDDDIDLSIFPKDIDSILVKLMSNIKFLSEDFQLKIFKRQYIDNSYANISIHCYHNEEDLFHVSLACLNEMEKGMYTQEVNITPKHFFEGYDELEFRNQIFKAPKQHKKYLEYTYGDWKVPKKNTSFYDNSLSYKESKKVNKSVNYYDYISEKEFIK